MKKSFLSPYAVARACLGLFICISGCNKEEDNPRINFNPDPTFGIMTDQDGNTYKTIVIGTQTWMAENLRVTHYRNGDPIPQIQKDEDWGTLSTGYCCIYEDYKDYPNLCGRLYK